MSRAKSLWSLALFVALSAGCETTNESLVDAQASADSGAAVDGSFGQDGAFEADSARPDAGAPDAAESTDVGTPDGSQASDSAVPADGGPDFDSGPALDGAAPDSGPEGDAALDSGLEDDAVVPDSGPNPDAAPDAGVNPDGGAPLVPEVDEPDDRDSPTDIVIRNGVGWAIFEAESPGDVDWYRITLEAPTDLSIGLRDVDDPSACAGNTILDLYLNSAAVPTVSDEDSGPEGCASMTPANQPRMRRIPAGVHLIAARTFAGEPSGPNLLTVRLLERIGAGAWCADSPRVCADGLICSGNPAVCAAELCGNGEIDGDEQCDDGNADPEDGCAACQWVRIPVGDVCDPLAGGAQCVDNAFCAFATRRCTAHRCGDGTLAPTERCDDGNDVAGDGCERCEIVPIEVGEACRPGRFPCVDGAFCDAATRVCAVDRCGDGAVSAGEQCDDGNDIEIDGCNSDCRYAPFAGEPNGRGSPTELIFVDTVARSVFELTVNDTDWFVFELAAPANVWLEITDLEGRGCNGDPDLALFRVGSEVPRLTSDDGGVGRCPEAGAALRAELAPVPAGRWLLRVGGAPVAPSWLRVRAEALVEVGGVCRQRLGYSECAAESFCSGEGRCVLPVCGDGEATGPEACDDGNADELDGCTSECLRAPIGIGRLCEPIGSPCVVEGYCAPQAGGTASCVEHACGDGVVGGEEICDDGNLDDSDGCDSRCELSPYNGAIEPDSQAAPWVIELDEAGRFEMVFSLDPGDDVDWFQLTLASPHRVSIYTESLPGDSCAGDVFVEVYDGDVKIAENDDGGPGLCAWIDPARERVMAPLGAGEWTIKVRTFDGAAAAGPNWIVVVATPVVVVGSPCDPADDQCPVDSFCVDETRECTAHRCGDSVVGPGEACDDGNLDDADGCTNACQIVPVDVSAGGRFFGTVAAQGETLFSFSLDQEAALRAETGTEGSDTCRGGDTILELQRFENGDWARIAINDDRGNRDLCSLLNEILPPGEYRLRVIDYNGDPIPSFYLDVAFGPAQRPAGPGDLEITEIMSNPRVVDDRVGEWFEVRNTTNLTLELTGVQILDREIALRDTHLIEQEGLVIAPGAFMVLGRSADRAVNGGVFVDYVYGNDFNLVNNFDGIRLMSVAGEIIDVVVYDDGATFPDGTGTSMQLSPGALDNADGANWCEASEPFGDGDLGTPGGPNSPCPAGMLP